MSASVFLSCNASARKVSRSTVQLTLDQSRASSTPDTPAGGILIVNKSSLPLYAISQADTENQTDPLAAD